MNLCLLLKHISKLHDKQSLGETPYIVSKYGWSNTNDVGITDNLQTPIWRDIMKGLDFFRTTTRVHIGNGVTSSFWLDLWLPDSSQTLAQQFHVLFSHSNRAHTSVACAMASNTLTELRSILAMVNLNMQVADRRTTRDAGKPFTTKLAYQAVWRQRPTHTLSPAIWRNYALNKCKIFLRRDIATSAACPFCSHCGSIAHLLFGCQHLAPLWLALDSLCPDAPQGLLQAWEGEWNNKTRSTFLLVVLPNIWKRRNAKVFRNMHLGLHDIASSAADDLRLWSHRFNNMQKQIRLRDWGSILFHLGGRI